MPKFNIRAYNGWTCSCCTVVLVGITSSVLELPQFVLEILLGVQSVTANLSYWISFTNVNKFILTLHLSCSCCWCSICILRVWVLKESLILSSKNVKVLKENISSCFVFQLTGGQLSQWQATFDPCPTPREPHGIRSAATGWQPRPAQLSELSQGGHAQPTQTGCHSPSSHAHCVHVFIAACQRRLSTGKVLAFFFILVSFTKW